MEWTVLLAVTLTLELPFASLRWKIGLFLGYPVTLAFARSPGAAHFLIFVAAYFGVIRAVISLAAPVGAGWVWRQREGGRPPSGPELVSYTDALATLMSMHADVRPPRDWFVIDDPTPAPLSAATR